MRHVSCEGIKGRRRGYHTLKDRNGIITESPASVRVLCGLVWRLSRLLGVTLQYLLGTKQDGTHWAHAGHTLGTRWAHTRHTLGTH